MKYCSHCGAELEDEAVVCVKCGCSVSGSKQKEDPSESTVGYAILGFFVPIIGLILFLLWNDEYPRRAKSAGKGALISVIVSVITSIIVFGLYFAFIAAAIGSIK